MLRKIGKFSAFLGVMLIAFGVIGLKVSDEDFRKATKVEVKEKLSPTEYKLFYSNIQTVTSYFDLYISEFDHFKMSHLSNKDRTLFVLNTLSNYLFTEVSEDQVTAEASKYFSSFDIYAKSIFDDSNQLLFKYQKGKFIYHSSIAQNYLINSEVISNEGYTDSWVVKKKIYFMKTTYNNNKYYNMIYKSTEDLKNNKEIYSFTSDTPENQVDNYINIKDKLNTYVYIFNRKNDQYFLDTVEKEN